MDGATAVSLDPLTTVVAVVILSILLTLIELPARSKSRLSACVNWGTFIYLLISALGYLAGTFLAANLVTDQLPGWPLFWHVFFGVFGFHIVLKHTNVTVFDRGVLTIQEWVQKALDNAIASSLRKEANQTQQAAIASAIQLRMLPEAALNLYVEQYLGQGKVAELDEAARASQSEPVHYKAFALAQQKPEGAAAILKEHRKQI